VLATQIEIVLKWVVALEAAITIMALLWADRIAEATKIDHQGLVEITSTNLNQELLWEILTPVTTTILHREVVITDLVKTTLLPHHTILQIQTLQTITEEVTQEDSMEVLTLTIEAGMPTTPRRIERETTMTEREIESTWIREMIRMEEAMTTIHQVAAVPTSQERVEAPTTVT
jgi:hypothetical protein